MDEEPTTHHTVIVIAGGDPIDPSLVPSLPPNAWTIAADSGLAHALAVGLSVNEVIGDMDSVDPALLDAARGSGTRVETHPVDKNETDLDLAVTTAAERGATRIVVVGGRGGRIDHLLGNALLLADSRFTNVDVEWRLATSTVRPVRPGHPVTVEGSPGDVVSILPVGSPAVGISTTGLRWQLSGDVLASGSTRGISNEMTTPRATIEVHDGVALVIHERNP